MGTIIWLSSELMFFAGLFAMYFTLRSTNPEVWAEQTQFLNVGFATVNTLILVLLERDLPDGRLRGRAG